MDGSGIGHTQHKAQSRSLRVQPLDFTCVDGVGPLSILTVLCGSRLVYRLLGQNAQHLSSLYHERTMTIHNSHPMRRSTRIERQIPVLVTSLDPNRRICERCHTVTINAHGCGVVTHEWMPSGTRVLLDLLTDPRQAKGVVIDAVPLDDSKADWLIGIELANFGNFWGLLDAPSDWRTQSEAQSLSRPRPEPEGARALMPVPELEYSVHLTDLSPNACYLETQNTFPLGSSLEVELRLDELRVRCFAVVRLVHPQTGMGLELTPPGSDEEEALLFLIQRLIASDRAAQLKALVRHPRKIPEHLRYLQRPESFAVGDSLLALILKPDSLDRKQFLEELGRQRAHPPTRQ